MALVVHHIVDGRGAARFALRTSLAGHIDKPVYESDGQCPNATSKHELMMSCMNIYIYIYIYDLFFSQSSVQVRAFKLEPRVASSPQP